MGSRKKEEDAAVLKAETNRLEKLFNRLDSNEDGRIDPTELSEGLHRMGYYHISPKQIDDFLKRSDATRSGDLNKSEFINYLREHEKQLHFVFSSLDENKDGKLCVAEIIGAFKKMGISITRSEAEALLKRINVDDNSLDISFEEWRDYLLFHPSSDLKDIIHSWRHNTCMDIGEDIGIPDDFTSEEIVSGMWWRHLVAGGCAGAVSRSCTAPLDRLKIVLQVHGGRKSLSMKEAFVYMYREGGLRGLWRGNGVNVIKIAPESALKFGAYDWIKNRIRRDADRELLTYERLIAGSTAGGISQSLIYPLEVLKTRFALRKTNEYKGIFDCVKRLYSREGLCGFYRGYIPNLLGILPYAGIDLTIYETLKIHYLSKYSSNEEDSSPPAYVLLSCGTFSSCCGQLAAYPLALVRTKLQSQAGLNLGLPKEQTEMLGLFRYILKNEGFRGLYRGILPNFCKVAPAVSISYYVYERTIGQLGAQMA